MKLNWKNLYITLKVGILIFLFGTMPLIIVLILDELGIIQSGNFGLGTGPLAALATPAVIILVVHGSIHTYQNFQQAKQANSTNHK